MLTKQGELRSESFSFSFSCWRNSTTQLVLVRFILNESLIIPLLLYCNIIQYNKKKKKRKKKRKKERIKLVILEPVPLYLL